MDKQIYNNKMHKLLLYIFMLLPLIILTKYVLQGSLNELNGINYVLCIISLPCSFLYYKLKKQKNLFLYLLIYESIVIEHFAYIILFKTEVTSINSVFLTPYIFRSILLLAIFCSNDKILNYINSRKKLSIILCFIVNIILIYHNNFVVRQFNIRNLKDFFYSSIVILTDLIIIIQFIRCYKKKDFIQSIYLISLTCLGLSMSLYSYAFNHELPINLLIFIKKSFFALSFVILLLGLFIEIEFLLLEKQKLTNDVIKISNNIQELRILEKVRAQFFANLSHELKTPLNIIFSLVQLIDSKNFENYEDIGRSYSKYSVTLKQNCYRMIRLINNLVDLTKIDSGFMNMNFRNYDIVNLVENIVMSVVPYMKNKKINIIFDTMIEELEIKCDSDSIERIILNLLSNSMKFSKESGNIIVFIDYDDEFVYIKVKDDGIGICEEKQKSVFDVFVQGDKSLTRKREGSGIGLSLVKSLVLLHNGDISLNSKVNNGTEITIKLPNKILETDECCTNDYNSSPNSLITKINIEFSDIYDLV